MHKILYGFLIQHRRLALPGIGTFQIQHHSASLDFGNRQINPPSFSFQLDPNNDKPSRKLFEWLSDALQITEWDAIKAVNDFAIELKSKVSTAGEVAWENIGIIRRDDKGNFVLDAPINFIPGDGQLHVEKVIREKTEHMLLVGEKERSSTEMEDFFSEAPATKNYALTIAIVLTVLSFIFIGWYFTEKGLNPRAAGNQSIIQSK